jgi:magnesium and cobalt transporter
MSDEGGDGSASRSWIERLTSALIGGPFNRETLVKQLRDAAQHDVLDAEALSMIERVLQVSELQVRDVMIPRAQMVVIEAKDAPEDFIHIVTESGHSRFPVTGDSRDDVQGILLAKDLLGYFAEKKGKARFNIRDYLRPAVFIPESKRLNVLLRDFRSKRNHMAIVADEYGGVAGLVTIEDVLEQIVGEIDDEYDTEDALFVKRHGNGEFTVKAITPIEDFNEYFHTVFSDEEFDTIGGIVIKAFGYMPKRGETKAIDGVHFKVLSADNRRIHLLRVRLDEHRAASAATED